MSNWEIETGWIYKPTSALGISNWVGQGFATTSCSNRLDRVQIAFGTYRKKAGGLIEIVLLRGSAPPAGVIDIENRKINSKKIDCSILEDNRLFVCRLPRIIVEPDSGFYLLIRRLPHETYTALTVWQAKAREGGAKAQKLTLKKSGQLSIQDYNGPLAIKAGFVSPKSFFDTIWLDPQFRPLSIIIIIVFFGMVGGVIKAAFATKIIRDHDPSALKRASLRAVITAAILICSSYTVTEWLFFVTKPSFLSDTLFSASLQVLFITPLFYILICFCFILPVAVAARVKKKNTVSSFTGMIILATPSVILAAAVFILIDNFTYTLLGFHCGSSKGWLVAVYACLFAFLIFSSLTYLYNKCSSPISILTKTPRWAILGCALLPILGLILFPSKAENINSVADKVSNIDRLPNIVILTGDGISANHMSVYGYPRKTTPFIEQLAKSSLVFQNVLPNCNATTYAVGALWAGKLPTTTGIYPLPRTMRGIHAHQHFIGFLHQLGYETGALGMRFFLDPYTMGFKFAFDYANGRSNVNQYNKIYNIINLNYNYSCTMLGNMISRLFDRLAHIAGAKEYINPFMLVTKPDKQSDHKRMKNAEWFISQAKEPFFLHVHLLGTHGPGFILKSKKFSHGQNQSTDFQTDFYDDAIREFDQHVEELTKLLIKKNKFRNAIFIISTDHGKSWSPTDRIPLIIHLPENSPKRSTTDKNTQLADIPPTILDLIGVAAPLWMEGDSLFSLKDKASRPIHYSICSGSAGNDPNSPFGVLAGQGVSINSKWYTLYFKTGKFKSGQVKGHTKQLSVFNSPSVEEVKQLILNNLISNNYDVFQINSKLSSNSTHSNREMTSEQR